MTSAHDRHLANYSRTPVEVTCKRCAENDVETSWLDTLESEYGQSWLAGQEDCRVCGASGDDLSVEEVNPDDYDPRNEYDPERDR